MMLFERISRDNRKKYGTEAEKILRIIINQYSDRTHFIYEILQNAEDAGATHIKFQLEPDRLVIYHNGRPFTEDDIEGVCGIANGTKEDGTRIGHFGIGFKSVYCYTELPCIYSGNYHFVIRNQLFPDEIPGIPELDYDETCMILPFDKADVSSTTAYQEIRDALTKKITAESILMLNSIADVEMKISNYSERILISKEKYPLEKGANRDNVFSLSMHTTITNCNTGKERYQDTDYLFFTDNNGKEATAIIFKVDGKELKAVKNSRIYAFFPTAKEAHQNFYIHAPFDTTPARDNFKEGAEYGKHNIILVQNLGKLIWFAFQWMRDHHYLSVSGLKTVFPIYEYDEYDVLYGLYQNSIDIIREEAILPTSTPGEFKRIQEVCVPLWGVIVDTIDANDLRKLMKDRKLNWLAKEISTEAYSDFRSFLNRNFELRILDWKDLVLRMDASFLKSKPLSWMDALTLRITTYCIKKNSNDSHYINASQIPFVRTTTGEQICARDTSGRLQVYLNNPKIAKYRIESTFLKSENIRWFYQTALGIPDYNIEQETVENVLPKYSSKKPQFKTNDHIQENIEDLKTIKDAIYTNPSIQEQLQDKYIVTDGKDWYCPGELYINENDVRTGYSLVKGIVAIRYLSSAYFEGSLDNLKLDKGFFKMIGCHHGIRVVNTSITEYLRAVRKYLGPQAEIDLEKQIFCKKFISRKLNWAFNYEGFPDVFENMTRERSLAIARFLNPNAMDFDIQGELVGADDQNYSGKNVDSMLAYSMLGLQLCFEKWIYIKGDSSPHRPLDIEKEDILPDYKSAKHLIRVLPFKEVNNALTEWLNATIGDKKDLDLVKRYMKSPEALIKVAKAMAKNEATIAAREGKSKSIQDLLESGDKGQQNSGKAKGPLEVVPISTKAKEKREKNLDKQLADSLDQLIRVTRGLYFASRSSNKEERLFLEQEYGGHCQICQKQILKHNGEFYFEAINFLRFNQMPEKLLASSGYGWNSLCLCPNCAAEYNNCSKKISTVYDQIMNQDVIAGSEDTIDINIELPMGEAKKIHYSPRHFMALKKAMILFAKEE